jgi:hypothetical protein
MSSPWDPAIAQAMQRHGGSNRSIPRTVQAKLLLNEAPRDPAVPATPTPEVVAPSVVPDRPVE